MPFRSRLGHATVPWRPYGEGHGHLVLAIQVDVKGERTRRPEHHSIHVDDVGNVDGDVGLRRRAEMEFPLHRCQLLAVGVG